MEDSIQEGSHPGEGISHTLRPYRQRLQQSKYEVVNAQTNTVKGEWAEKMKDLAETAKEETAVIFSK